MPQFNLIQAINEADGPGFLDKLKSAVPGIQNTQKPKKASAPPQAQPKAEELASPEIDTNVSLLSVFADRFRHATSGSVRYVLRMNSVDLKSLYLVEGGGNKFVENLSDEKITAFANNPLKTADAGIEEIELLPPNYTFKQLIMPTNSSHDAIVLLDIPQTISDELTKAKLDVNAARAALIKMMNHRYYVMVLSNSRCLKYEQAIEAAWKNLNELALAINPWIVIAYPNKPMFVRIHNEWGDAVNASTEEKEKMERRLAKERNQGSAPSFGTERERLSNAFETLRKYASIDSKATIGVVMKRIKDDMERLGSLDSGNNQDSDEF